MSKVTKKLISMIMCLAMTVTSCGVVALAADETTTAATETATATASPAATTASTEATATEEPTPEPTEAPSAYEDDVFYDRALTLCTALGIVEGYEDGSVKPDSTITRAEMSALVLRMLNTAATAEYTNVFNDVTSEHWAASTIQTAATMGIINGMGDGSFNPDGNVLYEQVEKMIVCALGYENDAVYAGGYPTGYAKKATDLKLTDHATGSLGAAADRGLVIKMIYNALLTKYNKVTGTGTNGQPTYEAVDTLAKAKFDLIDDEGILTATATRSTDTSSSELQEGQIAIDGVIYQTELTGLDDYVGSQVTFYYKESFNQDATVIAVTTANSKSTSLEITDMDDIKSVTGFEDGNGIIEMEKGTNKKCKDAVVIYNNVRVTSADFEQAKNDDPSRFVLVDADGNETGEMDFNDLFTPKAGSLKLIDDDDDGNYDTIFITAYETMLVTAVSEKKLTGKINNTTTVINVDTEANSDLKVTVTKAGSEVKVRNLKKNDVASIMRSLDGENITITVTGETIIGVIDDITTRDDNKIITVNDEEYKVDVNAVEDADSSIGSSVTLYLDAAGRVGYIESSTSGTITSSEEYAWLMSAYKSESGSEYMVTLFKQDGTSAEYKLASKVSYWAYNASEPVTLQGDERNEIAEIITYGDFLKIDSSLQVRLAKVKINSKDEVSQIHMAVDSSKVSDTDALRILNTNLNGTAATKGTMLGGYMFSDNTLVFKAPTDTSEMKSSTNYSVSTGASSYLNAEDGVAKDFVIGEFDEKYANVLIEFTSSAGKPSDSLSDYGTASDNSTMVVSRIGVGVDADDETVYIIRGYKDGAETSVTTTSATSLWKMDSSTVFPSKTTYGGTKIWDADYDTPISDYLHEGDVIGLGGNTLIKMVDVEELSKLVATGSGDQFVGTASASATRDGITIGAVSNLDSSDSVFLTIGSTDWYFDTTQAVSLVNVTTNSEGLVSAEVDEEGIEPSEIMDYDEDNKTGDYVFSRNFKNGAQREVVVYRFNED